MRYLICTFFLLFTSLVIAQDSDVIRLSEPVTQTDNVEIFGSEMDINIEDVENMHSLSAAISESNGNAEVYIKTKVNKVCKKKGCFFIAVDGEKTARVTFKDYSFFIPTDATGKEVVLRGVINEKVLTEEQAKHYAEDAGESSDTIVGEQKEYSIIATSVMIPKSK